MLYCDYFFFFLIKLLRFDAKTDIRDGVVYISNVQLTNFDM
jgi:hypothetical protein